MKKIYLIGNAHLDPVWLWRKQEGLSEIKSTFRSALDRMKEFPNYVFTSACAGYYAWIEQVDPEMFAEIRQRVAEGRWSITGGWWIQPDCNIPSGESFARHALYSQNYFWEKFRVTATVGYNVDSFGHNGMLPQLLRLSGMTDYVFMRPGEGENPEVPGSLFTWQSPDGSRVTAYRIPLGYGDWSLNKPEYESMETCAAKAQELKKWSDRDGMPYMSFYGVGNHGGGPTIRGLSALEPLCRESERFAFASVEDYFADIRKEERELPSWQSDLQHHASGCYAALSAVKAANRRAENALVAAENYDFLASRLLALPSGAKPIKAAWEKVLFNQFHDILAGCCIREAYVDALNSFSAAQDTAAEVASLALQRISWKIKTTPVLDSPAQKNGWILWEKEGEGAPLVVFNPHSFPVSLPMQINSVVSGVRNDRGEPVAIQTVRGPQTNGTDRENTLFRAEIPAWGYATYYLFWDRAPDALERQEPPAVHADGTSLENEYLRVEFDPQTGNIIRFYDKERQRELAAGPMARPVVVDDSECDTWAHGVFTFDKEVGAFGNAEIQVLDQGTVRAALRVASRYQDSELFQDFILCSGKRELEVRCRLDFHEKLRRLKLSFPVKVENPGAIYSMPYGFLQKAADGREEPSHEWMLTASGTLGDGLALLNDSKYSFSVRGNDMRMTVARGAIYADHFGDWDGLVEYQDQGEQSFRYALMPCDVTEIARVVRAAAVLNQAPELVLETHHDGPLDTSWSGIAISAENVIAQCIKYAENGGGTVLRLYETAGLEAEAQIALPAMNQSFTVSLRPQEIRTLLLGGGEPVEIALTERALCTTWDAKDIIDTYVYREADGKTGEEP